MKISIKEQMIEVFFGALFIDFKKIEEEKGVELVEREFLLANEELYRDALKSASEYAAGSHFYPEKYSMMAGEEELQLLVKELEEDEVYQYSFTSTKKKFEGTPMNIDNMFLAVHALTMYLRIQFLDAVMKDEIKGLRKNDNKKV